MPHLTLCWFEYLHAWGESATLLHVFSACFRVCLENACPRMSTADLIEPSLSGLLENPDFSDFLNMMIETKVDVPLLASGRTNGSSVKRAPMDVMMPDRDARQMQGYHFSLANDTSLSVLLKAWNKVRGPLLGLLTRKEACQASKKSCGGTILQDKGVTMFIPEGTPPVPFTTSSKEDQTWEVVSNALGEDWMAFEKILTEKCFCFWTRPNSVTVNPIETWQGPVPFVRQFQLMAVTATAAILRKGKGKTQVIISCMLAKDYILYIIFRKQAVPVCLRTNTTRLNDY